MKLYMYDKMTTASLNKLLINDIELVFGLVYTENEPHDAVYTQLTPVDTDKPVFCPCTSVEHVKTTNQIYYLDDEWKSNEGIYVTSTAEHTFGLILLMAKMACRQLRGKVIGIIGFGRIGNMVSMYAQAFGMVCRIYSPAIGAEDLDYLLKDSDIISLHIPLKGNENFLDKDKLALMKKDVIIVNTSRAGVVEKGAVIAKVAQGGYYADDFLSNHSDVFVNAMAHYKNRTMLSNHIGGATIEAREQTDMYIAKKIVEYKEGEDWKKK